MALPFTNILVVGKALTDHFGRIGNETLVLYRKRAGGTGPGASGNPGRRISTAMWIWQT